MKVFRLLHRLSLVTLTVITRDFTFCMKCILVAIQVSKQR